MRRFRTVGWIVAAGLYLLFALPLQAQDTRYYDPEGNVLSEAEYRVMISRWQDCLSATDNKSRFNRCLKEGVDAVAPAASVRKPSPSPDTGGAQDKGKVIWLLGPEEIPARGSADVPGESVSAPAPEREIAGIKATLPGSDAGEADDRPVRVIEREIPVPGGGVLKVREFVYE